MEGVVYSGGPGKQLAFRRVCFGGDDSAYIVMGIFCRQACRMDNLLQPAFQGIFAPLFCPVEIERFDGLSSLSIFLQG